MKNYREFCGKSTPVEVMSDGRPPAVVAETGTEHWMWPVHMWGGFGERKEPWSECKQTRRFFRLDKHGAQRGPAPFLAVKRESSCFLVFQKGERCKRT